MTRGAPPLRFLMLVVAGWIGIRTVTLLPDRANGGAAAVTTAAAAPSPAVAPRASPDEHAEVPSEPRAIPLMRRRRVYAATRAASAVPPSAFALRLRVSAPAIEAASQAPAPVPVPAPRSRAAPPALVPPPSGPSRWSGSAWLLVREELGNPVLAPGGTLGGSQAGGRLLFRLNRDAARPLALGARVYAPLRRTSGAEAALGLDWRPIARLPVNLLVERRQALGDEGRSAFALTLYGGASANLPARLRLDSYAQAGVVGARRRDLFVDGAARIIRPIGPVELGAGAWGAAQPGAARLDAGPQVSWRLPVARTNLRLSADWRFRIAGDAEPGSGPALTLGADF